MGLAIGFVIDVLRGAGFLIQDVHRALYRKFNARIWWGYFAVALVLLLWRNGQLGYVFFNLLTLGVVLIGLRALLSPLFERDRGRRRR